MFLKREPNRGKMSQKEAFQNTNLVPMRREPGNEVAKTPDSLAAVYATELTTKKANISYEEKAWERVTEPKERAWERVTEPREGDKRGVPFTLRFSK